MVARSASGTAFYSFFALSMLNRKSKLISTYGPPVMVGENLPGALRWKDLFYLFFFFFKKKKIKGRGVIPNDPARR